jgi:hypothetical protein
VVDGREIEAELHLAVCQRFGEAVQTGHAMIRGCDGD